LIFLISLISLLMSALLAMLRDYVPYFIIALISSPVAYLIEDRYKIRLKGLPIVAIVAAAGYRIFSYVPQIAIIALIAATYASSGLVMPRSSPNIRIVFSIAFASTFAVILYVFTYFL